LPAGADNCQLLLLKREVTMDIPSWVNNFPGAITVCDPSGIIVAMNKPSADGHSGDGGMGLIGSNLLDCHPEPARSKVLQMLENQQLNIYSIEKNGVKKLVYQTPWIEDGQYKGFIELVLEIPFEMPHFIRG
jgi:transcriptional regulator with PAS, ATPase and Fis domain